MIAKLSVTTRCNAACKTCPVWTMRGQDMALDDFKVIWDKLMFHPAISKVLINSTGDMYNHPRRNAIFDYIETRILKWVSMTTNAARMDRVPNIPEIIVSFNGATKAEYEYTTGLPFDETVATIRRFYPELAKRRSELHCLAWQGNAESHEAIERGLMALWGDFPGLVRVSYKYDNQGARDRGIDTARRQRIPCDYLNMLVVGPDGTIGRCSHDFAFDTDWGNLVRDDLEDVLFHPGRVRAQEEHERGEYTGLCEPCNYNRPVDGLVKYLKRGA